MATMEDFDKLDIRLGRIVEAADFPEARKPAYKLKIDFGDEIGVKKSSAQLVALYTKEELEGKLVLGVVNFPAEADRPLHLGSPDTRRARRRRRGGAHRAR